MKFELEASSGLTIRAYDSTHIMIGGQRYSEPLIITPDAVETERLPPRFSDLAVEHFVAIAEQGAEIILVGSGIRQLFLPQAITSALGARGVGLESMSTASAIRCYNVLAAEQRAVAAIIFPGAYVEIGSNPAR
jgi:uncharacterized protein